MPKSVPKLEEALWVPSRKERLKYYALAALKGFSLLWPRSSIDEAEDEARTAVAELSALARDKESVRFAEALETLDEKWYQLVRFTTLEWFRDVERAWASVESARAQFTISSAEAEIRSHIAKGCCKT